jgi:hypothetical protein
MWMYFFTRKDEILPFSGEWIDLEIIILREISQAQKNRYHMFSLICRM